MRRINIREASLLDASGELTPAARRELLEYLRENPDLFEEYHDTRKDFESLGHVPLVEPSAAERVEFPAKVKAAIHAELARLHREQRSQRRWKISGYLAVGFSAVAAAVVIVASLIVPSTDSARSRVREQAYIGQARLEHFVRYSERPTAYELAVREVDSSIGQAEGQLASYDNGMVTLLNTLAAVPEDFDDRELTDPLGSPGSL